MESSKVLGWEKEEWRKCDPSTLLACAVPCLVMATICVQTVTCAAAAEASVLAPPVL